MKKWTYKHTHVIRQIYKNIHIKYYFIINHLLNSKFKSLLMRSWVTELFICMLLNHLPTLIDKCKRKESVHQKGNCRKILKLGLLSISGSIRRFRSKSQTTFVKDT